MLLSSFNAHAHPPVCTATCMQECNEWHICLCSTHMHAHTHTHANTHTWVVIPITSWMSVNQKHINWFIETIQCLDDKSSWEHKQPHSNATGWACVIDYESVNQNVAPWIKSSPGYPTNRPVYDQWLAELYQYENINWCLYCLTHLNQFVKYWNIMLHILLHICPH